MTHITTMTTITITLPLFFRGFSNYVPPTAFLMTNFPGPSEPDDFFGCRSKQIS